MGLLLLPLGACPKQDRVRVRLCRRQSRQQLETRGERRRRDRLNAPSPRGDEDVEGREPRVQRKATRRDSKTFTAAMASSTPALASADAPDARCSRDVIEGERTVSVSLADHQKHFEVMVLTFQRYFKLKLSSHSTFQSLPEVLSSLLVCEDLTDLLLLSHHQQKDAVTFRAHQSVLAHSSPMIGNFIELCRREQVRDFLVGRNLSTSFFLHSPVSPWSLCWTTPPPN